MERKKLTPAVIAFSLLLAAIPTILWYLLRLQDGGGELAGLVPLGAAVLFAIRDRNLLKRTAGGVWGGILFLLIQAAAYPFLPAMIRALLMIATMASVSGIWKKPGILCLLILALPWTASLDFFLGYPLRLVTSVSAGFLLEMAGMDVTRSGVQLLYEGTVVGVDPACSGMNMLWSTGLLTALLAAVFSLRWRNMFPLGIAALGLSLAGNSLRAAILFFPEAGIVEMPHLLHPGIGVVIAGGCFLVLMKLARRFSVRGALTLVGESSALGTHRPAVMLLITAAPLVLLASLFSGEITDQPPINPPVLTSYQGTPVTRTDLSPTEKNFYGNFPGSIAVYGAADFKLIVRQVNRATRKLHPASHCLRAEGFRIGEKRVVEINRNRWLSYSVTRGGNTLFVKENITCTANGQNWAEIPAWYWHAFFNPGDGPWEAVTVISSNKSVPVISE